jgi:hypothetical protein
LRFLAFVGNRVSASPKLQQNAQSLRERMFPFHYVETPNLRANRSFLPVVDLFEECEQNVSSIWEDLYEHDMCLIGCKNIRRRSGGYQEE